MYGITDNNNGEPVAGAMGEERAARPQLDPLHRILLWCVVVGNGLVAGRGGVVVEGAARQGCISKLFNIFNMIV